MFIFLFLFFGVVSTVPRRNTDQALSLFGDAAVCNFPADEQVEVEGVATDGTTVKVRRNVTAVSVYSTTQNHNVAARTETTCELKESSLFLV